MEEKPPVYSTIFDAPQGENPYGKRTICEVHCDLYDLCVLALHKTNPEALVKIVKLLEEACLMGKKMNGKLVQYKAGMDEWAARYTPEEYKAQQEARQKRIDHLRGPADKEVK